MHPSSSSGPRLAVLLLVSVTMSAAPAWADDDTPDAHLKAGLALRREHKNLEALSEFQRANQLAPTPRARAQIGFAEQALARWIDAEADLRVALATPEDEWVARNREAIEAALRTIEGHLGWLSLPPGDPRARVTVDGVAREANDGRTRVTAGEHTVRIEPSDERPPVTQSVDVPSRADVRLVLFGPAPPPALAPAPSRAEPAAPSRPAPLGVQRAAGYALGVAGIVGIGTGLVLGGLMLHERSVVGEHCPNRHCDSEGYAAGQLGPSLATWSTVAFVGGAISLGAGTALVLTSPSPRAPLSGGVALRIPLP